VSDVSFPGTDAPSHQTNHFQRQEPTRKAIRKRNLRQVANPRCPNRCPRANLLRAIVRERHCDDGTQIRRQPASDVNERTNELTNRHDGPQYPLADVARESSIELLSCNARDSPPGGFCPGLSELGRLGGVVVRTSDL